ncbi:MAG: hypothetical protein WCS03_10645 [Bacteroidota bacterium]
MIESVLIKEGNSTDDLIIPSGFSSPIAHQDILTRYEIIQHNVLKNR